MGHSKHQLRLVAILLPLALSCRRAGYLSQRTDRTPTPAPAVQSPAAEPTPTEVVYRVGNGVLAPRLLNKARAPVLPHCRRAAFDWGAFIFEATISATGEVREIKTIKSPTLKPPCPELERAYREAISNWTYAPGTLGGKSVPVYLTISVAFHPQ